MLTSFTCLQEAKVFAELQREVHASELMRPRLRPYIATALCLGLLFSAAMYFAQQAWIVATALSIALFWQQVAFIGHDLGHSAVTQKRNIDNLLGLLVNAGVGIGMSWWKSTHNVHHLVVNSADSDPDIQVTSSYKYC